MMMMVMMLLLMKMTVLVARSRIVVWGGRRRDRPQRMPINSWGLEPLNTKAEPQPTDAPELRFPVPDLRLRTCSQTASLARNPCRLKSHRKPEALSPRGITPKAKTLNPAASLEPKARLVNEPNSRKPTGTKTTTINSTGSATFELTELAEISFPKSPTYTESIAPRSLQPPSSEAEAEPEAAMGEKKPQSPSVHRLLKETSRALVDFLIPTSPWGKPCGCPPAPRRKQFGRR